MNKTEKIGAIIAAAGGGERMGGVDKIWAELGGRAVVAWALQAFSDSGLVDEIALVLCEKDLERGRELVDKEGWKGVRVVMGGRRRQDSVANGLQKLVGCDWVLVHDGARPLVTSDIIERGLEAARETGAAAAAVPATDTVKAAAPDMMVLQTPPRGNLWAVQTPQVFCYSLLMKAHQNAADVTDDASMVEVLGGRVKLYMGAYDNIKITTPSDLAVAEALLKGRIK